MKLEYIDGDEAEFQSFHDYLQIFQKKFAGYVGIYS